MRIVIVTHFFPPGGGAGAIRPHALATELRRRGHDVVVITSNPAAEQSAFEVVSVPYLRFRARLSALLGRGADARRRARQAPSGDVQPLPGVPPSRFVSFVAKWAERTIQHPDKYRAWIREVDRWWKSAGKEMAAPDIVLASTPPVSTAYAGARLARRWGCPLVIDFRDLWTESPYYRFGSIRRAIDAMAEARLIAKAVGATVVTEELRAVLTKEYPGLPVWLVRTGVCAPARSHAAGERANASRAMTIAHFGSLDDWVKRDPALLLHTIDQLHLNGSLPRGSFRLNLYGTVGPQFLGAAAAAIQDGTIILKGTVPHDEAMRALAACDISLLIMWPGDSHSMPMKAMESMALGKTMLVFGAGTDSEIRRVLGDTPGVYFCDDDATAQIALQACWERFSAGKEMDWPSPERARPFLASRMADDFERIFTEVVPSTSAKVSEHGS